MKVYLITGGAGFIGSNYIHYLFDTYKDNVFVINVDALTYAGNLENLSSLSSNPKYCFVKERIENTDKLLSTLESLLSERKLTSIDYCIHFAAESHVDRSILSSRDFVVTNVLGTQSMLDISRQLDVTRFVHVSTDEVYGTLGATGAFVEDTPLSPNSPYSASKAGSDLLVRSYVETHGMDAVITRCSNNYGPYQFPEKLIPLMISHAVENKSLPIYGTGENIRDWIYVEDHARGVDEVARRGIKGEVYNLGGASEMSNLAVVRTILDSLNKPESLITYVKDRPGHDFRYAIDFSKATKDFSWTPTVSFAEGLKRTIEWYLANNKWLDHINTGEYQTYYKTQYEQR